jgi:hypothetical protein
MRAMAEERVAVVSWRAARVLRENVVINKRSLADGARPVDNANSPKRVALVAA